jgi:hypothetical protein
MDLAIQGGLSRLETVRCVQPSPENPILYGRPVRIVQLSPRHPLESVPVQRIL